MSDQKRTPYTAKEIVEILEKAKELGVTNLSIEGFQASWELQNTLPAPKIPQEDAEPANIFPVRKNRNYTTTREIKGDCPKCGSEFIQGNFGPYCRPCYLKRKEANWQKFREW